MDDGTKKLIEIQIANLVAVKEFAAAITGLLVGTGMVNDEQAAVILYGLSKRLRETDGALAGYQERADSALLSAFADAFHALGKDHERAFRKSQESW